MNTIRSGVRLKILFRISLVAKNKGGINLFGSKFGDYKQHIYLNITYNKPSV